MFLTFFLLVIILSIPLWWLGGSKLPIPIHLPVSALTAFVPAIAAAVLLYRQSGWYGVKELFRKARDFKKINHNGWYLPALLLAPFIYILSYRMMRLMGTLLPAPINYSLFMVLTFFVMFFIAAAGEELGWSGYVLDMMQNRLGTVMAGLSLGIAWAIWHSVSFIQTGEPAIWVFWQCIKTISMRLVIAWLYNNTGKSVFATILYHTSDNVSWSLFPNYGSNYDPLITGLITTLVAFAVIAVDKGNTFIRNQKHQAGTIHERPEDSKGC